MGTDTKTASGKRVIPLFDEAIEAISKQKVINAVVFDQSITDISTPIFRTPKGSL